MGDFTPRKPLREHIRPSKRLGGLNGLSPMLKVTVIPTLVSYCIVLFLLFWFGLLGDEQGTKLGAFDKTLVGPFIGPFHPRI